LRRIPFFFWLIGLAFLTIAILLTYNVIAGKDPKKRLFNSFVGNAVWEYIIIVFVYIIGISMFVVAKYETIRIEKNNNIMILSKFYLFCCKAKTFTINLSTIDSIFPVNVQQTGNSARNTCLYKIGIRYNQRESLFILKSFFKYFIIKDVMRLRYIILNQSSTFKSVETELKGTISYG
jgi:hypothetical protein